MASIYAEYQRFLEHLAQREIPDDVRRLAHLVAKHLQPLSEVGAARRGRSSRLAPLAVQHLATTPAEYDTHLHDPESESYLGRLQQLEVGPFRGFMRQEIFDLSHDITLVYGANGTGKSSFCEALEMAMLGSISEAQVKRVDERTYCNNARLHRHETPVLITTGTHRVAQPNEGEYRFCFIEKNRLDDFARIAARTPGDQRQLIATLFGVDQFSDFVRGFNPSLDHDLMLTGVKATELAQKRTQLANAEQVIATYPQKIAQIDEQERALAQRISPGTTYQECVDWLLGTEQQQGRLPYVQSVLDAAPPVIHGVARDRLSTLLEDATRVQSELQQAATQLVAQASEVSYSKLYEAVLELADGATACPACGTELTGAAQDPFARARIGLQQLEQLAALQQRQEDLKTQLRDAVRELWEYMCRVVAAARSVCPAELQQAALPQLPPESDGDWLGAWTEECHASWNRLMQVSEIIERADAQSRAANAQRGEMALERDKLDQFRLEIDRLQTKKITTSEEFVEARQTVDQFEEANRALIQAAEEEVPVVAHHHRIKAAYDGFLPEIQTYLAALPGVLLQGLGEQARSLYNAFNRDDPPGDLLHALWLPLAENGKIEVEFAGEPGTRYDALIVFSEGHIKCLGLAILLAKNITHGCPVVIFDDVVNAIDDEHRNGIWRTFFENGLLDDKQIILTSHAEEFLHRIQQELGADRAAAIKRYKFLPHQGEHDLRVDSAPPTKNYILLAQQALDNEEKREALRHARPALESLTDRLWTWLGRRADGRIELKLAGPRSPWELNNKCSKLRSSVRRIMDQHEGAPDVHAALDNLLGVGSGSIEWSYLNSGVHDSERDHEFDRTTVQVVVEAVSALDEALERLRNR